jgi:hypothetical protein
LKQDVAEIYAQFFYQDGDNFIEGDFYKKFLYEQVFDMKKPWETQNIPTLYILHLSIQTFINFTKPLGNVFSIAATR